MDQFRRLNKNSNLYFCTGDLNIEDITVPGVGMLFEDDKNYILQIWCNPMPIKEGTTIAAIIEYLPRFMDDVEEETPAHTGDIDFENYLETVINKDPFGGKYSGKPIKQVFIDGNKEWLNKALTELKNEFLRDRLQYIMSRGGYGKICRV